MPFADVLGALEDGHFVREAETALFKLTKEMSQVANAAGGKPAGKLVLTLNIKLDGGIFEVIGEVATKRPKKPRPRTVMWERRDGALTPTNPRQLTLDLLQRGGQRAADTSEE